MTALKKLWALSLLLLELTHAASNGGRDTANNRRERSFLFGASSSSYSPVEGSEPRSRTPRPLMEEAPTSAVPSAVRPPSALAPSALGLPTTRLACRPKRSAPSSITAPTGLQYLIINVREAADRGFLPREFLLVFPGVPLTATGETILQMVEHHLWSRFGSCQIGDGRSSCRVRGVTSEGDVDGNAFQLCSYAGAGLTVVSEIQGRLVEVRDEDGDMSTVSRCGDAGTIGRVVFTGV